MMRMVRTFRTIQLAAEEDDENVEKSRTIWWAALEEEGKTFPKLRMEQQLSWSNQGRDTGDNDEDDDGDFITYTI